MSQYVMKFSKEGFICYTSHLDMLRLFKRAFKKAGIRLAYSQGFNPHPKMGFAQPLSLGYSSISEYLEFETQQACLVKELKASIEKQMPQGIHILECEEVRNQKKSMAARCEAAEYIIGIPMGKEPDRPGEELCRQFLSQEEIRIPKRQKKSKELKEINIRDKIRLMNFVIEGENLLVTATLDSGSESNLSPELLIAALVRYLDIKTDRAEMDVMRTKLIFKK